MNKLHYAIPHLAGGVPVMIRAADKPSSCSLLNLSVARLMPNCLSIHNIHIIFPKHISHITFHNISQNGQVSVPVAVLS